MHNGDHYLATAPLHSNMGSEKTHTDKRSQRARGRKVLQDIKYRQQYRGSLLHIHTHSHTNLTLVSIQNKTPSHEPSAHPPHTARSPPLVIRPHIRPLTHDGTPPLIRETELPVVAFSEREIGETDQGDRSGRKNCLCRPSL